MWGQQTQLRLLTSVGTLYTKRTVYSSCFSFVFPSLGTSVIFINGVSSQMGQLLLCAFLRFDKRKNTGAFFGNMVALQYLKSSLSLRGDFLTTTSGLDYLDHQLTSSAFRQNGACTSWGWVEPGSPGQLTSSHQAAPWKVLPIGTFVLWRKVMSTH